MSCYRYLLPGIAAAALAAHPTIAAAAEPPTAVASIKPVHSLLSGVMEGAGEPSLLVRGGASPHTWTLRPSDAHALEHADLVVWVGEGLESFLVQPIEALTGDAYVLELSRAEGITLLRMREGGAWDEHGHDEEGEDHDDHAASHEDEHDDDHKDDHAGSKEDDHDEHEDDHAKGEEDDHEDDHAMGKEDDHDDHGEKVAGAHGDEDEDVHVHHEDEDEHGHGEFNMHVWLDPENAAVIVGAMADALARLDPERKDLYEENEASLRSRLATLDDELKEAFAPVRDRGFIVFHDAWQYLDIRYGLRAVGSVTVNPDQSPGAARLAEIREKITSAEATCVFAEPQFEPRLVRTLVEGTGAATGTLDPLGAALEDGPDLYFDLMRENARAFRACFGL